MVQQEKPRDIRVDYALETPTAAALVESIVAVMGQHEGIVAWRTACSEVNERWPGVSDQVETLMRVLTAMTKQSGLAQVVARSSIIRLHTWTVLSRVSKQSKVSK